MTAAVQKNLELPYEEYERFDLSVQRVYKLIWVLCRQRVHVDGNVKPIKPIRQADENQRVVYNGY